MSSTQESKAYALASSYASRNGIDMNEAMKDFGKLIEIKQRNAVSDVPEKTNLSAEEKKQGFGALLKTKMSEANNCSIDEFEVEMENIKKKYNLNTKQADLLSEKVSSQSKGGEAALIRFVVLILSMGLVDIGG